MINAEFFLADNGELLGFHIKGHSGMAESGKDVLCAFVSSAAYMAANTISDVIKADADIYEHDGEMYVMVKKDDAHLCRDILRGLKLHLLSTEEQYSDFISVNYTEV